MSKSNEEAAKEEIRRELDEARMWATSLMNNDYYDTGDMREVFEDLERAIFEILEKHGIMHE